MRFIPFGVNALIILGLLSSSSLLYAKDVKVTIYMKKVQPIKVLHEHGDHIYFNINEYPTQGDAKVLRVPDYPSNWQSKILPCMHDIKIWEGVVSNDNSVVVLLTVMDQTFEMLEDDNLIGSVMVEITNKNNKIKTEWTIPNVYDRQQKVEQVKRNSPKYLMFGNNMRYTIEFKTSMKPI